MSWEALDTLPVGHYGVGRLGDGEEIDIYRLSLVCIWNVTTGQPAAVIQWRRSKH